MKNYGIYINTSAQFTEKYMQRVGSCQAKNKAQAIEFVYAAFHGKENDAIVYPEMVDYVTPSSKSILRAIIED